MTTLEQIQDVFSRYSFNSFSERVSIKDCLNRVLAEDIYTDSKMPPFDRSRMDGFACRKTDLNNILSIIEDIPAGSTPEKKVLTNQCAKIMTGSPIPIGADFVMKKEDIEYFDESNIIWKGQTLEEYISYAGEDYEIGTKILKKGIIISPIHMAILASCGYNEVKVNRLPKVALVAVGSELLEPEITIHKSKIRNSNSYQLIGQLKAIGSIPTYFGIIEDNKEVITNFLLKALIDFDVIITTGGISVGEYDFLPLIYSEIGVKLQINNILIKPGKPFLFGTVNNKTVIGLSGNSVSSFVQFEFIVRPFFNKYMGVDKEDKTIRISLDKDFIPPKCKRTLIMPVMLNQNYTVTPIIINSSGDINSLSSAFGLTVFSEHKLYKKGTLLDVRQL